MFFNGFLRLFLISPKTHSRPNSIIRQLKLTETKYLPVAAYGHIGREDLNVRWEDTDKTEELLSAIK